MYLTGFADEAASGIDDQIKATRELGWKHIEARNVDGLNVHDLSDEAFDTVAGKLADAGVQVNCFGSAIANWSKSIEAPPDSSYTETARAIPRMQRLGTKLVRIMSFAIREGHPPDDQMKEERFKRIREIVKRFTDAGLQPVHENCMNYGGMGWRYTLELIENVPGLKLVFDTANPVFTNDFSGSKPYSKQSSWEFYSHVKTHIAYVHIKDACFVAENEQGIFPKADFTFAGEGDGDVRRIVTDLVRHGYDGGFSIEPHLDVVYHEQEGESREDARYRNYVEYGHRFEAMLRDIRSSR
jgi:sugar phosphate isomerase/epimerase